MSHNKPPMTVWTSDDINAPVMGCDGPKRGHWGSVRSQVFRHGPYILKDWLNEELLKRAREGMRGYESPEKYFSELGRAVIDILRELNGGKNEL